MTVAAGRRILHVSQPSDAGVAVVVRRLTRDHVARGWEVAVACSPEGDLARWVEEAGATVLPWRARRSPGPGTLAETARLGQLVRRWQPDLVHLHSAKAGLAGRLAIRGRVPTVFQPHAWSFLAVTGAVAAMTVRWERLAARWAGVVACVSEGERKTGVAAGITANWALTPNGVDTREFPTASPQERRAARARLQLPDAVPLVVCVGRLCRQKGQDVLLAAWPAVSAALSGAELALIGDGPDAARLRRWASPATRIVPATSALQDWYAAANLVVQPSRWEAGAPLTVLEAMATGRSVVVSDVPGAREVLTSGFGALVPPDDPAALATAMLARLHDPGAADAEGHAGTELVQARFSLAQTNQRMAELYDDLLDQRHPEAPAPTTRRRQLRPGVRR